MLRRLFGFLVGPLFNSLLGWLSGWFTRRELKQQTQRADAAEAEKAQDEQVIKQQETRHDVDQAVESLPEAPAQRVGDADPATAAGKLRAFERD